MKLTLALLLSLAAYGQQTQIRPTQIKGGIVVTPVEAGAIWGETVAGGGLVFTLAAEPLPGTVRVWRSGLREPAGRFLLVGRRITFYFAVTGDRGDGTGAVVADYQTGEPR